MSGGHCWLNFSQNGLKNANICLTLACAFAENGDWSVLGTIGLVLFFFAILCDFETLKQEKRKTVITFFSLSCGLSTYFLYLTRVIIYI